MSITPESSSRIFEVKTAPHDADSYPACRGIQRRLFMLLPACLLLLVVALSGCGGGGYAGGGIVSLSASAITLDAGQAIPITSQLSGSPTVSWSIAGSNCTGTGCGTLSGTTGPDVTYQAPAGLASPIKLVLTASIANTSSSSAVNITVNPDPVISGTPPPGVVGVPYTATLTASGGTGTLKLSLSAGSLPPGLTFNPATGVISGTPTAVGTSTATVQLTDQSSIPDTVTAQEVIPVTAPSVVAISISGNPPAGTVGTPYTTTLLASGGTAPYTWSLLSGSLPAGLSLSASGILSGTPSAAGASSFTVQALDANGNKASAAFGIAIAAAQSTLTLTTSSLPGGTVGTPYSATIGVSGGTAPYACAFTSGTLPAGLTLSGCVVSGTPTAAGTSNVIVKATDSSSPTASLTGPESITIAAATPTLVIASPPGGTVGVPYSGSIGVTGGAAPYTCTITSGSLPAGLSINNCLITGTPTASGSSTITVKATDSSNPTATQTGPATITIAAPTLMLSTSMLPNGTVGTPYSATIGVSGGTAPYTCVFTSGTLPAGLTLSGCTVSGTPTTAITSNLTVKATDSSNPTASTTGPESITISAPPSLVITSPPGGTVGTPYTGTIGVSGGTGPYTCALTSGTLPTGLSISNCTITGTPTTSGSSTVTVKATDSGNPTSTQTGPVTVTIAPSALTLTPGTLPNGTVGAPYSATIGVTGGTGPYTCVFTSGTLPAGLTLTGCTVSGTPTTPITSNLTVKATDSSNPANTVSGPESITIAPAPLALTTTSLPNGTVGTPYSATIGVTGGTGPYTCVFTSGTLPAGLTLTGCTVSGTPTTPITSNLTVKATDSSNPANTVSGPESITIAPAPLSITTGTLPNGTVGTPYSSTIGVSGGTAPYTCTIVSGTLQAGLTLSGCLVSGTPTVAGTANLTVKATDSSNPTETTTGPVSLTIVAAPPTLTIGSPASGTVGLPYNGTIPVSGGTAPYTCTYTGTLSAGLTFNSNCTVTGTPTMAGSSTITVTATDSSNPKGTSTGPATITINAASPTLTISSPPAATVGTPYSGTIPVSGGTAPYMCTFAGTLPAGLTFNANCTITGTPTTAGSTPVTVTATDSSNPSGTTTSPITVTVNPVPPLTLTGSLPDGIVGVPYTQTLNASGGIGPYTYTSTGTLPAGLTLSSAGVISGTPTTPGASSFTVTATDSETTPQTASLPLVLLITYPVTATDAEFKGSYAFLFQGYDDVVAGVLAYQTATVGSFTADGAGGISAGELDTNHQASNPTGATISSNDFLGTYTLGTDNRGLLTLTVLNADGTTGRTSTYAIAVKAPTAPATTVSQGSLIEFDSNQLVGTKGTGTLLAQTTTAFAAGLNGSYAFGLQGDTPCLPSCTANLPAGPAASVGEFTTNGSGTLSAGSSDANIAATQYVNQQLSGSYGSADAHGRLQLSMSTAGTPAGFYPTDYAVYVVNANQAFVLSTDKHSSYVLLAGSAQLQTQASYSNASLTGPFIGYENSPTNPGLVGATLQNTLNLSTATIFRATSDAAGDCTTTNVDQGGTTALANGLTGLGSGAPIVNALLGTYASTGASTCTVAGNGRGVLNYPVPSSVLSITLASLGLGNTPPPARVVYLISPDHGYFLETGYAGLGTIEQQTGAPYSLATFNGTYIYDQPAASSLASTTSTGFITADGAGHATSTQDENVGVGTLNVLDLGVTSTTTYTTPDATTGRFILNGTIVVYTISPNRFVLLDTNPLTTSPSVSLLY